MDHTRHMSPAEYGAALARQAPPLTDEQIEQAARLLASALRDRQRAQDERREGGQEPAPDTEPDPRLLYTVAGAARQLSISERTMRALVAEGEVDSVLLGRRRLVPHDALAAYVHRLRSR